MIKKATAETFETFAEQDSSSLHDSVVSGHVPPHFLDGERVNLYLTLSGLLDAGIPAETALRLIDTESKAQNRKHNAERIAEFFLAVTTAREAVRANDNGDFSTVTDTIGEAAERCFGRNFASPDELVLLRGLAYTDNVTAILRAAADVIRNKSLAYSPARPNVSIARRYK